MRIWARDLAGDTLSRTSRQAVRRLERVSDDLTLQLGRAPTPRELAFRLGISLDELAEVARLARGRTLSLEQVMAASYREISREWEVAKDMLADPAVVAERRDELRSMRECLEGLSERDRTIIRLRYESGLSLAEIGERMAVSESRACQLHRRALDRLRRAMEGSGRAAA